VTTTGVLLMVFAEAAVLGIGLAVRFPRLGPSDLARASLLLAGALLLAYAAPPLVATTAAAAGAAVALTLVVLPALTATFWAMGCFFRLVAATMARAF
jgi:hypothetical protein